MLRNLPVITAEKMRHSVWMLQLLLLLLWQPPCDCVSISRDKESAPEVPSKLYFAASEEAIEGVKGHSVVLPCEFRGEVPTSEKEFKVIWQKNKKTLTFDKAHLDPRFQIVPTDIHTRNKFDVKIKDLRVSDEGMYRCIASYQSNYLIKNVTLLIKVPPTIDPKKSSPLNLVLVEGTSQALTCMADGVPRPRIVWYRLVDDNKIELSNDSIYLIRNVTRDMAGTVACVANNTVDPVDTREFSLIVHYAPTVSLMNEQISQRRSKATMVMCSIRGKPDPQFYWEYRGRRFHYSRHSQCNPPEPLQKHCMHLTMNEGTETRQLSLLINNLTDSDYGQYYCVGHSALGSDRKVVRVTGEPGVQEVCRFLAEFAKFTATLVYLTFSLK
uniref:Lachesin-like n=1 Tax=Macrostomum lignano TaxID=282301 RepID=A0A1I8G821_9PLAT